MFIFIGIATSVIDKAVVLEKYTNSVLHVSMTEIRSNIDNYYGVDEKLGKIVKLTNEIIDNSIQFTSYSEVSILVGFDAKNNNGVVSRVLECEAELTEPYVNRLSKRKIINIGELEQIRQSASERIEFVDTIEKEYDKYISNIKLIGINREFDYTIIDNECVLIDYKGNNDTFIVPEFITAVAENSLLRVSKIIVDKHVKFISKKCSFGRSRKPIEIVRLSDSTVEV